MLSPDPLIQAPEDLQSFNRYSYVWNNPLSNTDPSGFKTESIKSGSEAATASTQLAENVSSTEISSQDNVGGEAGSESSEQVNDYYSDGSNIQVDQTNRTTEHQNGNKDVNPALNQVPPTDIGAYGLAPKESMKGIDPGADNPGKFAAKEGTKTEQYTEGNPSMAGTGLLDGYDFGGGSKQNRPPGTADSKDPNYVPPSTYQPPVISAARPGSTKEDPEFNPISDDEYLQAIDLTIGASYVDPMMADLNATILVVGLSPYALEAALPTLEGLAAPATTYYLQNAPRINQTIYDELAPLSPSWSGMLEQFNSGFPYAIWNSE